eukprot:1159867-Pelagomonas_calceolata.AAC.8
MWPNRKQSAPRGWGRGWRVPSRSVCRARDVSNSLRSGRAGTDLILWGHGGPAPIRSCGGGLAPIRPRGVCLIRCVKFPHVRMGWHRSDLVGVGWHRPALVGLCLFCCAYEDNGFNCLDGCPWKPMAGKLDLNTARAHLTEELIQGLEDSSVHAAEHRSS